MRVFLSIFIILLLSNVAFAQEASQTEEEGLFQLNQNPLAPGQTPVHDERLTPNKDASGIVLPQGNNNLPFETAFLLGDKKKKPFISKDFIFGFITGGAFIAFVSFFMLKYARKSV